MFDASSLRVMYSRPSIDATAPPWYPAVLRENTQSKAATLP